MKRLTKNEFIINSKKIHENKYDYSKVEYVNNKIKVCIICPKHGEFWQRPNDHLKGKGCPLCRYSKCSDKQRDTKDIFIDKAISVHGNKYDYSKVIYKDSKTKVCIICTKHGEFWQTPNNHLNNHGCPLCKNYEISILKRDDKDRFIKKSNKIHNNKYEYSNIKYVNSRTKIVIICPVHGEFWQTPNSHLNGHGCPKCQSSVLEKDIRIFLQSHKINFQEQKRFEWLGQKSLDFYLPDYKVGIECQGRQHFKEIDYFGGIKGLQECIIRDKYKFDKCVEHNIKILYYSNLNIDYPYKVYEDMNSLLDEITNKK